MIGGDACTNQTDCNERYNSNNDLMSSNNWPTTRKPIGIFSNNKLENPAFFNYNKVIVPYCSSDLWTGNSNNSSGFFFRGSLIIKTIISHLKIHHKLNESEAIVLSGTSAGAYGILVEYDLIMENLVELVEKNVPFHFIIDSGWLLANCSNNTEYLIMCKYAHPISFENITKFWNSSLPKKCNEDFSLCTTNFKAFDIPNSVQVKFIVMFWNKDRFVIGNSNQTSVLKSIKKMSSIHSIKSLIIPSCSLHGILNLSNIHKITINGQSIPELISCIINEISNCEYPKMAMDNSDEWHLNCPYSEH